ncbi:MAG TPA: SPOR domain-containing protein [Terracidiphilus sp.]|nr:SPOR domain-containing protein [Terracidiphilus sp.]
MRGYFDDNPRESSRGTGDTELTLGSGMLLTVFFGLVLICGLCFGLGYAVGSRGSKSPEFQSQPPAAGPSPQLPSNSQQGKPSAAEQPSAVPAQPVAADQAVAGVPAPAATNPAVQTVVPAATTPGGAQQVVTPSNSGWRSVQPALPGGTGAAPTAQPAVVNQVRPAVSGQGALMVQIAALSNQEDASVLIGALQRRGYTVSAVRSPADNFIHVCIGPFSNRADANSMKLKLQSDGYNAQVVP